MSLGLLHESVETALARILRFLTAIALFTLTRSFASVRALWLLHIGASGLGLHEFLAFRVHFLSACAHCLTTFLHGVFAGAQSKGGSCNGFSVSREGHEAYLASQALLALQCSSNCCLI